MTETERILCEAQREKKRNLLETDAKTICKEYGIPITNFSVARTELEAVSQARKIGFPVVLKIVSPDVVHKSDVGGVIVNVSNEGDVKKNYAQILANVKQHQPRARIEGVLVQEMAPPSTEIIIGSIKDPQFGPTIMFGLGGIFVEVLKDVTFRIAPIEEDEAREMITEVKAYPLLKGYRNIPPADVGAIIRILLSVSRLVMEHQEISEVDLNPIMVYEKGAKTVDARIIIEQK